MFRRNVKSLNEVLQEALRDNGLETPLLQKRLIDSWPEVVGSALNKYTGDIFIKNQTLFVKINNPALRQDLSMTRGVIVKKLNAKVATMLITDIHFY